MKSGYETKHIKPNVLDIEMIGAMQKRVGKAIMQQSANVLNEGWRKRAAEEESSKKICPKK